MQKGLLIVDNLLPLMFDDASGAIAGADALLHPGLRETVLERLVARVRVALVDGT
ncbi:hypothetical protein ABT147_29190 [Streptomyces sp. NPDC001868]|uniref:hypothetical protein n=1 Tax=Streptomyces sp. NPDC001868 TaxID=3154401 RepID=UPI00332C9059